MQEARKRVTADGAGGQGQSQRSLMGLSQEDCDEAQRRLDEVLRIAQLLVFKVQSTGSSEELARYAARVRGDLAQAEAEARAEAVAATAAASCGTPGAASAAERPLTVAAASSGDRSPRARSPRGRSASPPNQNAEVPPSGTNRVRRGSIRSLVGGAAKAAKAATPSKLMSKAHGKRTSA